MTRVRVAAGLAGLLSVLLLQASVVGPLTLPIPASLPAVLVAAIALVDGPGAGLSFGFTAGLVADLGSEHPAGVLALCWLGIGLICGRCASSHANVRRDAALAALSCGLGSIVAAVLLAIVDADGSAVGSAVPDALEATLVDALLALAVVPLVRAFLRSHALRAPVPVLVMSEPAIADRNGARRRIGSKPARRGGPLSGREPTSPSGARVSRATLAEREKSLATLAEREKSRATLAEREMSRATLAEREMSRATLAEREKSRATLAEREKSQATLAEREKSLATQAARESS